ncbi:MAG: hypothetical protein F4203_03605 [Rhodobacteraceae bacterium]|nr:hypothetical protein [Paracoccaceae bacterium]
MSAKLWMSLREFIHYFLFLALTLRIATFCSPISLFLGTLISKLMRFTNEIIRTISAEAMEHGVVGRAQGSF